ncbi:MAG: TerB family tellurite resistance protein [Nannocystaceae bacterium]
MDVTDKKLYCEIIAQVLIIDGMITDDERAFLDEVFARLGLSDDERRDVINHVNVDDAIEEKVARLAPEVREQLTAELEGAAGLDSDVSPGERDLIARVKAAMGA